MSIEKTIDCIGLSCPQPVIMTKKALDELPEALLVLVDNAVSKENVTKFAIASGYGVSVDVDGTNFRIRLVKKALGALPQHVVQEGNQPPVYLITKDTLGSGSEELGAILMKAFFSSLQESNPLPKALLFLNAGVHLTVTDSPVLQALRALSVKNVAILSCGTCLDYYHLKEKLAVGEITNMFTILAECNGAGKTITL